MSYTLSSPFAHLSESNIAALSAGDTEKTPGLLGGHSSALQDVLTDGFVAESECAYEELDTLSALERYCRSDLPAQRLTYAAGIGAAVADLEPSSVSGTVISLLRELLADVYADVRLTALQQVVPVGQRLRSAGSKFQSDLETLWDLVQPLLMDPDVECQALSAAVLAEVSHLVAIGNCVAASQKLVWAVQRLQVVPKDMAAEGALAALRLITEVVAPRSGSPLKFDVIEDFAVGTFKAYSTYEASPDVRQAVALLLPRFLSHLPPCVRASLLPGLLTTLAADTHWNVRAEVPELLVQLATGGQAAAADAAAAAAAAGQTSVNGQTPDGHRPHEQQQQQGEDGGPQEGYAAGVQQLVTAADTAASNSSSSSESKDGSGTGAAVGAKADDASLTTAELHVVCEVAEKLCRDSSNLVKVPALASLGQLLPSLPVSEATSHRHHRLLQLFAGTAKPPATLAGVKVPLQLLAPRLAGKLPPAKERQRLQQQQLQQEQELEKEEAAAQHPAAAVEAELAAEVGSNSSSKPDDSNQQQAAPAAAATAAPAGCDSSSCAATTAAPAAAAAAAGTAAVELPLSCAFHFGRVAAAAGLQSWPVLQPAFLTLAATAAVGRDADIGAALLLGFPRLAGALGQGPTRRLLAPVVMELLHCQLDELAPVLSVTLHDVAAALPADLRICLLQLLPALATLPDRELAGDWRARLSVARQLPAVAAAVTPAQVAYCLWPLLLTLARDPVAAVRADAALHVGSLLARLPEREQPPEATVEGDEAAAAAAAAVEETVQEDAAAGGLTDPAAAAAATGAAAAAEAAAGGEASVEHYRTERQQQEAAEQLRKDCEQQQAQEEQQQELLEQQQQQQQEQQQEHEQQQQQQQKPGTLLRMFTGMKQLHKQIHEHVGSEIDNHITWLQQQPTGSMLHSLGQRLTAAGGAGTSSDSGGSAVFGTFAATRQFSLGHLKGHLGSLDLIQNLVDPCRYLPTPGAAAAAADLATFRGGSSSERQVYVLAAGSLAAESWRQQQQQHREVAQLLAELQQLAKDPVPGVRCCVAAVAGSLLRAGSSSSSSTTSGQAGRPAAVDAVEVPAAAAAVLQGMLEQLLKDSCTAVVDVATAATGQQPVTTAAAAAAAASGGAGSSTADSSGAAAASSDSDASSGTAAVAQKI